MSKDIEITAKVLRRGCRFCDVPIRYSKCVYVKGFSKRRFKDRLDCVLELLAGYISVTLQIDSAASKTKTERIIGHLNRKPKKCVLRRV